MKKLSFIFTLLYLLASCSKETVKTPGQITADEINSVAKQHSITYVEIWATGFSSGGPVTFTLEGQYIVTNGTRYYNLEKLKYFYTSKATLGSQQVDTLELYFE